MPCTIKERADKALEDFLGSEKAKETVVAYIKSISNESDIKDKTDTDLLRLVVYNYSTNMLSKYSYYNVYDWCDVIPYYSELPADDDESSWKKYFLL